MTEKLSRSRRQLIGMFGIALATLAGSYVLFFLARESGVWGTTNNGAFVDPPVTMAELRVSGPDGRTLVEGQTWWLWVVVPQGCDASCEAALHQLRQLHVLLNKDADRVRRALVTGAGASPGVFGDYPQLVHLRAELERLDGGIYILDPIGNLVLRYPLADAGKPVLEDLKKLLKVSQIG